MVSRRLYVLLISVLIFFSFLVYPVYATRVYMQGGIVHYDTTTWPQGIFGECERMRLNPNVTETNNGLGEALSNNSGIILDALYEEINITIPGGSYLVTGNYTMYVRAKANVTVAADLALSVNAESSFNAPSVNFTYYLLEFYVSPAQQIAGDDFQIQIMKNQNAVKTEILVDYFILSFPKPSDARVDPSQLITWYIGPLTQPDPNLVAPTIMNVTLWSVDNVLVNGLVTVNGYGVGAINMTAPTNSTEYPILLLSPGSIVNGTSSFIVDHYNVSLLPIAQTVSIGRSATLTVRAVSTVDGYVSTSTLTAIVSGVTMNPTGQTGVQNGEITITYDNMTFFNETRYGITNGNLTSSASVRWYSMVTQIVDDMTMYLFVIGLVPMILAGALIVVAIESGEFNKEMMLMILSGIVGMFIILVVWVSMTSGY